MRVSLADEHGVLAHRFIRDRLGEIVIDITIQGRIFYPQSLLRCRLRHRLLDFQFDLGTFHPKPYNREAVNHNRRHLRATEEEPIRTAEIANGPMPILKSNGGMNPADKG